MTDEILSLVIGLAFIILIIVLHNLLDPNNYDGRL